MKLEAITIGEILAVLVFIGAFIKAIEYLYHKFVNWADNWLNRGLQPIRNEIERLENKITNIDGRLTEQEIESMRPELMRMLSLVDRGNELGEWEKKHLAKLKKDYNDKGGDSYIDDYYEELIKERKL